MTKRYDEYKDSGIEWLGEIPSHWNLNKIKNTTYLKARIGWHGLKSDDFIDKGNILVTGTDFKNGIVDYTNVKRINDEKYNLDTKIQLKENDLLITKDGTIGKTAIVKNLKEPATLNSGVFLMRSNRYLTKYMYWVLNSSIFKEFISLNKSGTTILHLYQNVFEKFAFPLMEDAEQQAIADYLDNKISKIDSAVSELEKQKSLLIELKKSTIHQAVTKGLDLTVPMKDSGVEWIGEVPSHWDIKNAKDFYYFSMGNTILKEDLSEVGIPVYSATAEDKFFGFVKNANLLLKKDDLVISARGTIGFAKIVKRKSTSTQTTIAARKKSNINSKFVYYYLHGLQNEIFKFDKTAVPQYTVESAKTIKVCVPKKTEQNKIVSYLDKKTGQIDQSIEVIDNQIAKMKEYKKTLINDVVTGKIKVV